MEHMHVICERFNTVSVVSQRLNLSVKERMDLLSLEVKSSITCNCGRRHRHEEPRQVAVLERLVTDAVLKARWLKSRSAMGAAIRLDGKGKIEGDTLGEVEGARIIFIDFKKRRRITE